MSSQSLNMHAQLSSGDINTNFSLSLNIGHYYAYARSECSDETAHVWACALAFKTRVTYVMEYRSLEISTNNSMTGSNYSTVLHNVSQHQNA